MAQDEAMQMVMDKGLRALSAQEVGELLTHLGMQFFIPKFRQQMVCAWVSPLFFVLSSLVLQI